MHKDDELDEEQDLEVSKDDNEYNDDDDDEEEERGNALLAYALAAILIIGLLGVVVMTIFTLAG